MENLPVRNLYKNVDEFSQFMSKHLVFGTFKDVINLKSKKDRIFKLSEILEEQIRYKPSEHKDIQYKELINILKFLALNIGRNLSFPILTKNLNLEKNELKKYLSFLEDKSVIFKIRSFSRSLPKEMSKAQKFYFWDNGIRNMLINNFNSPTKRTDMEQVWENFCISERLKRNNYLSFDAKKYFWMTYDDKEIAYLEEAYDYLFAFGFSWKKNDLYYPRQFLTAYSNSVFTIINPNKFWDFIA